MSLKIVRSLADANATDLFEIAVTSGQTVTAGNLAHISALGKLTPTTSIASKPDYMYVGATTYPTKAATSFGVIQGTVVGDGTKTALIVPILHDTVVESAVYSGAVIGDFVEHAGTTDHTFVKAAGTNPAVGMVLKIYDPKTGLDCANSVSGAKITVRFL